MIFEEYETVTIMYLILSFQAELMLIADEDDSQRNMKICLWRIQGQGYFLASMRIQN